jgi:hypothetical protein
MAGIPITWSGASTVTGAAPILSDAQSTQGSIGFSAVVEVTGTSGSGLAGNLYLEVSDDGINYALLGGSVQSVLVGNGVTEVFAFTYATFYNYVKLGWAPGSAANGTLTGTWQVVSLTVPPVIIPPSPGITPPPGGITQQPDTGALAVARLRSYLKINAVTAKPNVAAFIQVFCNQCDDLESSLQQLFYYRQLNNAILYAYPETNVVLDNIGVIVGLPRNGLPDALYQVYLRAQILADSSSGTTNDLNGIFSVACPSGVTFQVNWQFVAAFMIYLTDPAGVLTLPIVNALAQFMREARGAGIGGVLEYSYGYPDDEYLQFMSATDTFDMNGSGPTNQGIGLDQGLFRGATN